MNKKPLKTPKIGLYSLGHFPYWKQFPGLKERLESYGNFISQKLSLYDATVYNFGIVDSKDASISAGEYFAKNNVDLVFCHSATYGTSATILPIHKICKAPVIILNLQPGAKINYSVTTTGEWLSHCGACPVPEICNALSRAKIKTKVVNGLLGLSKTPEISMTNEITCDRPEAKRAWKEIYEWVDAARVKCNLMGAKFGFLGNTYNGMLDLYSNFTSVCAQTGIQIEILEMCDLERNLRSVKNEEVEEKLNEINSFFNTTDTNAADPLATKPSAEQLDWSARIAVAQEALVKEFNLDALTYYYHGAPMGYYEKIQGGFIVGHSLLTAAGIPCSGEGDLKTCLAMKICDILGKGGSFCEIVVTDYDDGTILLGHDGPFHLKIARGKPYLRGMALYHGKQGTGISVEAKVKPGPITNLNCTETSDGRLKFIITEAEAVDRPIMTIGNTQTPVKFNKSPDEYMDEWFAEAPTHHFAMSTGHNESLFKKVFEILDIPYVSLNK